MCHKNDEIFILVATRWPQNGHKSIFWYFLENFWALTLMKLQKDFKCKRCVNFDENEMDTRMVTSNK